MKKILILFVAVFTLCSCSKDDDFDNGVDQNTPCAAEYFFNSYYNGPIPDYKIKSLEIKDYQWPTQSESGKIVKVDGSLITIHWYNETGYELSRNVYKIGNDLKNIGSPDYVKTPSIIDPCLQIVCMHQKTRGRYNRYIK